MLRSRMEGNSQIVKEWRVRTLKIDGRASSPLCPSSGPLYRISLMSSSPRLLSPSSSSSSSSVFLLRERDARSLSCSQRKTWRSSALEEREREKERTSIRQIVLLTMLRSNVSGMEGNSKERRVRTLKIEGRASSPLYPPSGPLYRISLISSSPRLLSPPSSSSSSSVFLLRERGARSLSRSQKKTWRSSALEKR